MTDLQNIFPTESEVPKEMRISRIDQKRYLVNGELKEWNAAYDVVESPVCIKSEGKLARKVLGTVPSMTQKESLEALQAASNAYEKTWGRMSVKERIGYFEGFVKRMSAVREPVVKLLMWEIGKNVKDASNEFDRTLDYIKASITELKDMSHEDSKFRREEGHLVQIRRAPYGKTLCMGPFNYPLNETFTTLIPALLMGNTAIFKPAKYGVLIHEPLLEAYKESFPAGVINTIYGDGRTIIGPLMSSGKIDMLQFIGSNNVGNALVKQHPKPNLQAILGLGAKNPAFILEDADMEIAIREAVTGSLSYNGQRCTALKSLYVHEKRVEEFVEKFSRKVESLKIGMPWTQEVNITPMPEHNKIKWMREYVEDALKNGAKVCNENGGEALETLFVPAVLYPVNDKMKIYHEEQFGPVVPIISYKDIREPLASTRASEIVGQQAAIFGYDEKIVGPLYDELVYQVCRVNLNGQCKRSPDTLPFTGRKSSAMGVLSVRKALEVSAIETFVSTEMKDSRNIDLVRRIVEGKHSKFMDSDHLI